MEKGIDNVIAFCILILVLIGILFRGLLPFRLPIWSLMISGAIFILLTGQSTVSTAWHAINFEVLGYLFGVFILAETLESSGFLERITEQLFAKVKNGVQALIIVFTVLGLGSAILMNDTTAIIGTPLILQLCRKEKALITPLLLSLAFGITVGSILSPIGNPQNLLIATQGPFTSSFLAFIKTLALPTIINLMLTGLIVFLFYRKTLLTPLSKIQPISIINKHDANLSKISLAIMVILILSKIILDEMHAEINLDFSVIALITALPIILFSRNRLSILKNIDWGTLLFFTGMFIIMQSVWDKGIFQHWISQSHIDVTSINAILIIGVLLSQLMSNVPLVALYIPLLTHSNVAANHYLALAASATIAGNLLIFGAASNIIILQNAEKRSTHAFSVWEFSRLGIMVTLVNLIIYAAFI